ncbi:MAG: hypothetical protein ABSH34_34065, partial [Verrucomicrobiota bacterium]
TRVKPAAKAGSDTAALFAAIIWQQDYAGDRNPARIVAEATPKRSVSVNEARSSRSSFWDERCQQ